MFGASSESLGKRFLVADLVPAAIFCAAVVVIGSPELQWLGTTKQLEQLERQLARLGKTEVLLPSAIFFVAVLLSQLSRTVQRLFQGYLAREVGVTGFALLIAAVAVWLREPRDSFFAALLPTLGGFGAALCGVWLFHAARKEHFRSEYDALERLWKSTTTKSDKFSLEYQLSTRFPRSADRVLPTRFGNLYRSAEYYPRHMFNIDAITMWPRLLGVIPDDYAKKLEDAETGVAFSLNMSIAAVVVAVLCFFAGFRSGEPSAWSSAGAAVVLAFAFYQAACNSVAGWGQFVRAAFDLFRLDLLKKLQVKWPAEEVTIEQESEIWRVVQRVTFYNHQHGPDDAAGDAFIIVRRTDKKE